jgi:hypothetical protein
MFLLRKNKSEQGKGAKEEERNKRMEEKMLLILVLLSTKWYCSIH